MRMRLPRRWKAAIWKLRDQIRPPRLVQVPADDDPLYTMLAARPAWSRRQVTAHLTREQRVEQMHRLL
ncbi:MAG: hypothetical protein EA400_14370 [Chromatiaceae bacterium]|nr:MAG: hypothetical protein EA400_14370 [Chromatiaceae bacterium]